jgi:hypothetical protein
VKRQDPIVLFGSLSYSANIGSGTRLRSGSRLDNGDVFGGRLGAFLAVTPDISLLLGVSANSFSADRFDSIRSPGLRPAAGRGRDRRRHDDRPRLVLNVNAAIGVTPAAPNFALTISVPYRF